MWLLLESVVDRLSEFWAGMDLYGPWMDETASRDLLSRAGAGQMSTSGSTVMSADSEYNQVHRWVWLMPGPWEDSFHITGWVSGQAGLALHHG